MTDKIQIDPHTGLPIVVKDNKENVVHNVPATSSPIENLSLNSNSLNESPIQKEARDLNRKDEPTEYEQKDKPFILSEELKNKALSDSSSLKEESKKPVQQSDANHPSHSLSPAKQNKGLGSIQNQTEGNNPSGASLGKYIGSIPVPFTSEHNLDLGKLAKLRDILKMSGADSGSQEKAFNAIIDLISDSTPSK